jgi:hypothetical protein
MITCISQKVLPQFLNYCDRLVYKLKMEEIYNLIVGLQEKAMMGQFQSRETDDEEESNLF